MYYFPKLVSSEQHGNGRVVSYFKEPKRRYTRASSKQVALVACLGILSILIMYVHSRMFGLWWALFPDSLDATMADASWIEQLIANAILGLVDGVWQSLFVLSIAFLVVPPVRHYRIRKQNRDIIDRNAERSERAVMLGLGADFIEKVEFARQFAIQAALKDDDSLPFSETFVMTQKSRESIELEADFLRRLNEI